MEQDEEKVTLWPKVFNMGYTIPNPNPNPNANLQILHGPYDGDMWEKSIEQSRQKQKDVMEQDEGKTRVIEPRTDENRFKARVS